MNKNKSEKNNFQDDIKKHKKLLEIFSGVLFGRLVFVFFLIFLQILLIFVLTKKFSSYISFYFGGSILFSTIFMCYLSNSKGKNEFKIAWILPMVIFPFFAKKGLLHLDAEDALLFSSAYKGTPESKSAAKKHT